MEMDIDTKLKELKEFERLQQATHYRLCESIAIQVLSYLEIAEQVEKRLENIEKKLNVIIISEMDSEDGV